MEKMARSMATTMNATTTPMARMTAGSRSPIMRRSSLRTTPDGVGAWAQSLERLGLPVARRHRSLTDDPPRPGVLVVLEPILAPTPAEVGTLLAWVRERLSHYKCPRSVEFVDDLGRNTMGKINKRKLRAPYWEGRERQVN